MRYTKVRIDLVTSFEALEFKKSIHKRDEEVFTDYEILSK